MRGALDAADVLRVDVVIVIVIVLVHVGDDVGDGVESQHHHGQKAVRVESVPSRGGAKWKCKGEGNLLPSGSARTFCGSCGAAVDTKEAV